MTMTPCLMANHHIRKNDRIVNAAAGDMGPRPSEGSSDDSAFQHEYTLSTSKMQMK